MGASLDAKRLPSEHNQAILNHLLGIAPTTDLRGLLTLFQDDVELERFRALASALSSDVA